MNLEPSIISKFPIDVLQCIGVAYTFDSSVRERSHLASANSTFDGSAIPFSYFYKGDLRCLSGHDSDLSLRNDPLTGERAIHSPEPELAMLLGERHSIIGYCLANDFTASSLEGLRNDTLIDSTYYAKVWKGCGSFGPVIVSATDIGDLDTLTIGLKVARNGTTIFDSTYSLSHRNREFKSIPMAIVEKYHSYGTDIPVSKRIIIDQDGYLPAGTLIMLGTGLIVSGKYHCQIGDKLTVYCEAIGELSNIVRDSPA